MSVLPHEIIRLPLDGFSVNMVFEYFSKIVEKFQDPLKPEKEN
jgi:hypothetical protein